MADMRISNVVAIAMLDALVDAVDSGGAGSIEIREGTAPTACEDGDTGTLLATLAFGATAFGGAADGTDKATVTANTISDETNAAAGTAGYFRVKNGGGTVVLQGTVTATAGGGDMELSNTTIAAADTVTIGTSYTIDLPET